MIASVQPTGPDRRSRIEATLSARFQPASLMVEDDSARHAGHAGAGGGETHFNVLLVSLAFGGQNRVQRSRAVHAALDDEFRTGLHALSLTLRTPDEAAAAGPASALVFAPGAPIK